MDEMEKDLEMKIGLVRKFVSRAGLNNAAESALEEIADFSQDYGEGMEDFKSYLSDIKEHGFDTAEYPLYSDPHYYERFIQDYALEIEEFYKIYGMTPSDLNGYDKDDFLFQSMDNQKLVCDFMFTVIAGDFLDWLNEEEKKNG